MAPVKFSTMMVTVSAGTLGADHRQPGEGQVRQHLQRRRRSTGWWTAAARATIEPPAKPPIRAAAEADALDHRGIGRLVEADIDDEGGGQHAGKGVAEFEQHHEQQNGDGGVAGEEFAEGAGRGFGHGASDADRRF